MPLKIAQASDILLNSKGSQTADNETRRRKEHDEIKKMHGTANHSNFNNQINTHSCEHRWKTYVIT